MVRPVAARVTAVPLVSNGEPAPGMYIPEGYSEGQVVGIIRVIAKRLAYKYRFGYYDVEDIVQQAVVIVIKSDCLRKYDPSRPLEGFLYTHLNNRLYNFKRDNYCRPNPPCNSCPIGAIITKSQGRSICSDYDDKLECKFYRRWYSDTQNKKNIMHAIPVQNVIDEGEPNMSYDTDFIGPIHSDDIRDVLLENLSFRGRKSYLIYSMGGSISKTDTDELHSEIRNIAEVVNCG